MALPPKDVPASALFLKLMELPRPSEVIDFPRKGSDGKPIDRIRIQTLTSEDQDKARAMAHAEMLRRGFSAEDIGSYGIREVYSDAVAKELIAMSCLTAEGADFGDGVPKYGRVFRDGGQVSKLAADEILTLFNAWQLLQHKYGPIEGLDQNEVDAWIKRLVEGGSGFPLLELALPDLVELTTSLAARIYSVCEILAGHLSTLPPSLGSSLESLLLDIGSYGDPAAKLESTGGASKPDVTLEQALSVAKRMKE